MRSSPSPPFYSPRSFLLPALSCSTTLNITDVMILATAPNIPIPRTIANTANS